MVLDFVTCLSKRFGILVGDLGYLGGRVPVAPGTSGTSSTRWRAPSIKRRLPDAGDHSTVRSPGRPEQLSINQSLQLLSHAMASVDPEALSPTPVGLAPSSSTDTSNTNLAQPQSTAPATRSGSSVAPIACLACRSKHLKCDGANPCARCAAHKLECSFVRSRRGYKGPRRVKAASGAPDSPGLYAAAISSFLTC